MKTLNKSLILIMLVVLVGTANALHVDVFVPSLDKIGAMIDELRPLMNKPLSWCKISESGEFRDYGSTIDVDVNIKCDFRNVNKVMNHIYKTYGNLLKDNNYYPYIDSAFETNFPHYRMYWGDHQMAYDAFRLQIIPRKEFMSNTGNSQSYLYFKVKVNGVVQDSVRYFAMGGAVIDYSNRGNDDFDNDEGGYVVITKQWNKSFDSEFIRIWDFDETDTFVNAQRVY